MNHTRHAVKTVVLAGALLAACTTQHARPARSTVGCAEAVVGQLPPALTDPEKHCLASALMVQQCSLAEAWLAGWGKEVADAFGAGDADWDDLRADRLGRDCAVADDDAAELLACCRRALHTPAPAQARVSRDRFPALIDRKILCILKRGLRPEGTMSIRLIVNGEERAFNGDEDMPLLWYLRDHAGLTGTKFGCGEGLCGACTVLVDGQPRRSCGMKMSAVEGRAVTTIEGLGAAGLHPVQKAWIEEDVMQCGYCQTGQILSAVALLESNPDPTEEEIESITNLCRCGTYVRIRRAIRRAASEMREASVKEVAS